MTIIRLDYKSCVDSGMYPMISDFVKKGDFDQLFVYAAINKDALVGISVTEPMGRELYLRYVYIVPWLRHMGLCKHFLAGMIVELSDTKYQTLHMDFFPKYNPEVAAIADRFTDNISETDNYFYRFKLSDISLDARPDGEKDIVYYKDMSIPELKKLHDKVLKADRLPLYDPFLSKSKSEEISVCHVSDDGIDGALFVDQEEESLYISFLWSESESMSALNSMFEAAFSAAGALFDGDTVVEASVSDDRLAVLIDRKFSLSGEMMLSAGIELI